MKSGYAEQVVVLCEDLPLGEYTARVWLEETTPDRSVARRPPPAGGGLRLWLSYYLVMGGGWASQSRSIAAFATDPASQVSWLTNQSVSPRSAVSHCSL
eukprot:1176636-Prorocentrum_minimum.AAC.1